MIATAKLLRFRYTLQVRRLVTGLILAALALCGQLAQADSFNFDDAFRDMQQTMLAREALHRDQDLGPLNLGVHVENRVAFMWGSVPTKAMQLRAIQTIEHLPGILRVRSELFVDDEGIDWPSMFTPSTNVKPDPPQLAKASSPWVSSKPKTFPQQPPAFVPEPVVQPRDTWLTQQSAKPVQPQTLSWQTTEPEQPIKTAAVDPPNDAESGLFVLPVAMAVGPHPNQGLSIAQRIPVSPLREKLNRMRDNQARYQSITIQIVDAKVYLGGHVPRLQDVHEFARAVSYLPDVDAVIIGQVQAASVK